MTHEYAGKYAAKHPAGTAIDERIAQALRDRCPDGRLLCAVGEKISKDLQVEMAAVGLAADLLEMKIKQCQLGLFGHGTDPNHGKDVQSGGPIPAEVRKAIQEVAVDGAVTCSETWKIADQLGVKRKAVAGSCEALGLKIRKCQLGAF